MEDRYLILGAALAATVVLWLIAAARGRVRPVEVLPGALNGLLIALALGGATALVTYMIVSGLSEAVLIAMPTGFVVGAVFLWIGLALMPIGLLFGGGRDWARYGTWVAVVILIVSLGLGWTAYTAFQESAEPTSGRQPAAAALGFRASSFARAASLSVNQSALISVYGTHSGNS